MAVRIVFSASTIRQAAITQSKVKGASTTTNSQQLRVLIDFARGLPLGYLTRLEARLAETEDALYRIYQERDQGPFPNTSNSAQVSQAVTRDNKYERVEEWTQFPLNSIEDIEAWYRFKAFRGVPSTSSEIRDLGSPSSGSPTGHHLARQRFPSSQQSLRGEHYEQESRAAKLQKENPGMYF